VGEGIQEHPLAGWIPWRINPHDGLLDWLPLDGAPYKEPFFEETLLRLKQQNRSSFPVRTAVDLLAPGAEGLARTKPVLFIFHVTRCGSTLLARMLGADPGLVILPEPPLLDDLLRAERDALVDPMLALLGQRRFPESTGLVVKLDSWALAFHGRLRALYPTVPFALLYREPGKVQASQQRMRGLPALPGVLPPALFGFDPADLPAPTPGVPALEVFDAYFERVLARYFEWMAEIAAADPRSFLVDFEEGPEVCYRRILAGTGLAPGAPILDAALERTRQHGKRPWETFQPEPPAPAAPPGLQAAYARLDGLRRGAGNGGTHAG
jgi:hypothetical protein